MTLLIAVFAAVISTVVWYVNPKARELKVSTLCYMFWGASLMWFVDAMVEFSELRAEYFAPEAADVLNDTFLGLAVVALALVIWVVTLLIKDPNGIVKEAVARN